MGYITCKYFTVSDYQWINYNKLTKYKHKFANLLILLKPYKWINYKWVVFDSV